MIGVSYPMPSTAPNQAVWFKSSFSSNANQCVEVRFDGEHVSIRDSKYRRNPVNQTDREPIIAVTAAQWAGFLSELTGHAAAGSNAALSVETGPNKAVTLRATGNGTTLRFTESEWRMYLAGVRNGEFDHPGLTAAAH